MKNVFIILAMSGVMLSCKHKASEETKVLSATELRDSLEYAKYKETKAREAATQQRVVTTSTVAPQAAPTVAPKKKGMSKAAKGTIIGAGSGAILGAIIDKNHRGRGAIIGGAAGGGTGYIIGRKKDKKSGRVQ